MSENTKTNDGGPAFPKAPDDIRNGSSGMSLRDYFAGQALTGEISGNDDPLYRIGGEPVEKAMARDAKRRAEWCYAQADAMLAARASSEASR